MDQAYNANREDVRSMRERAKWHASWAVRLGILGLLLLLPLALQPFAAPAVAVAAVMLVLATSDASEGNHRRAHQRFGLILFLGVLAHVAWIPSMIEDGKPSKLLFVTLIGFMVVTIGSMSTVWAGDGIERANRTEMDRTRTREQLRSGRTVGRGGEDPGPLRREEIARLAAENGGKGMPQATAWKGTPSSVNTDDERHPKKRN